VVEGVARTLNPNLNMWVTAEPVVRGWIERRLGPVGKIEEATGSFGRMFIGLPAMLEDAKQGAIMLADMANSGGLKLDDATTEQLARAQARNTRWTRLWLAVGAISLGAIALKLVL
jgi:ubiquinone biosynthesis protein